MKVISLIRVKLNTNLIKKTFNLNLFLKITYLNLFFLLYFNMSLEEVYQLLIDESEDDYNNNMYLKSENHINNIIKLLENYINKITSFNDEEMEFIPLINEKLNDIKDNYDVKLSNRIKRYIIKSEKIIKTTNEILEDTDNTSEINESKLNIPSKKIRSDFDLIPSDNISIVDDSLLLFDDIIKEETISNAALDDFFKNPRCVIVNSGVKDKTNLYGLDRFGLVIRRKAYLKKNNVYGWKYDNNMEPVHILTNLELCEDQENIRNVINAQFMMEGRLFNKNGVIYKIYSRYYPERLLMLGINQ